MIISFLRDESAFKAASKELLAAALASQADRRVMADGLYAFLLRHVPSSDVVLSAAKGLAAYLNRREGKPKLCHCLQALAHEFTDGPYESLLGYWLSDLSRALLELDLPAPELEGGHEVVHPYPPELQRLPWLQSLRSHWERNNISTSKRAFMPPMPPPQVFGLDRYGAYEIYRSWRPGRVGVLTNQRMAIVLTDGPDKFRGLARWNWWGHRFHGSDFTIYAQDGDGWQYVTMDLRPYKEMPDRGPLFMRLAEEEAFKEIKQMIGNCSYHEENEE